ncbi:MULTISPECIES: aspartate-semialdehyde dehydrogenase [Rhizobium]|uniref:Aspartate-semialdehyde dehydrogenase n=1 Tax=Rhizobium leguminosarum bv. viciae TaxID=387 RepID=A0A8G2MNV3_RHILV|nr:aspartate-semialdehyde dehydrogenase [Rhizobium leguminosarum]NKK10466.1 aspartate-semialdehyde dehydrogenase [Rhizobium leguminosarum bv. viciae]NKK23620.1 aspartate-semialdehyde dehydrogenase [Rhizobium leguminosarum bv. viciae]TBX85085.1 aspartate-semialdehyde dehydrogenase [Rhizobium leguminosarum bv. viciae]TBY74081.1 aspartate-semialdehyde dehydrogenase [Rhizobium leguminosarum bv. viciae]TBZ13241.1 aspartate-semialdehyde dehydrogenase [Rhizobium leguminosarum bv. viciae]
MRPLDISVVGATGAVGTALIKLLEKSEIKINRLRLFASSSGARQFKFRDQTYLVEALRDISDIGDTKTDIAFFSAGGDVSAVWGPRFASQGALVIDNSNAFRMRPDVPLIVPQVNACSLTVRPPSGIVANPNCSTIQLVRALRPLIATFGVNQVLLTTYQAASGVGLRGINELEDGAVAWLEGSTGPAAESFPVPLAFNVIPQIGEISREGVALEERKLVQESRKIFGMPHLQLTATCVRVPVKTGHSEAVYVEFDDHVRLDQVRELLANEPGVRLYADEIRDGYPTPRYLGDPADVHVGRVRVNPENPRGLWMWVVADNVQVGAALNALLIAQLAIANNLMDET